MPSNGLIELAADEAEAFADRFDLAALEPASSTIPFPTITRCAASRRSSGCPTAACSCPAMPTSLSATATRPCDRTRRPSSGRSSAPARRSIKHHTTSLVFNDPPLHTRVRKLLAAAFTPRALAAMQARIEAVVDGLIERHADARRMDLVEDFAFRLPVEVICDMLGVPPGDRAPFRRYSLAILGALEPVAGPERQAAGNAAVAEFSAYLDDLIAERCQAAGRRP